MSSESLEATSDPAYWARGIRVYAEQRRIIKDTIAWYGGRLHRDDFDLEFSETIERRRKWTDEEFRSGVARGAYKSWLECRPPRFDVVAVDGDSFILGSLSQGEWARWLDLAQCMVRAGEIRSEVDGDDVWYCHEGDPQ